MRHGAKAFRGHVGDRVRWILSTAELIDGGEAIGEVTGIKRESFRQPDEAYDVIRVDFDERVYLAGGHAAGIKHSWHAAESMELVRAAEPSEHEPGYMVRGRDAKGFVWLTTCQPAAFQDMERDVAASYCVELREREPDCTFTVVSVGPRPEDA